MSAADKPAIAQLVEHLTVDLMQLSDRPWFDSGWPDIACPRSRRAAPGLHSPLHVQVTAPYSAAEVSTRALAFQARMTSRRAFCLPLTSRL